MVACTGCNHANACALCTCSISYMQHVAHAVVAAACTYFGPFCMHEPLHYQPQRSMSVLVHTSCCVLLQAMRAYRGRTRRRGKGAPSILLSLTRLQGQTCSSSSSWRLRRRSRPCQAAPSLASSRCQTQCALRFCTPCVPSTWAAPACVSGWFAHCATEGPHCCTL